MKEAKQLASWGGAIRVLKEQMTGRVSLVVKPPARENLMWSQGSLAWGERKIVQRSKKQGELFSSMLKILILIPGVSSK